MRSARLVVVLFTIPMLASALGVKRAEAGPVPPTSSRSTNDNPCVDFGLKGDVDQTIAVYPTFTALVNGQHVAKRITNGAGGPEVRYVASVPPPP